MDDLQEMEQLIEQMRQRLHDSLHGRCFTDPEVVKASQALNKVLNEYERLLKAKCKGNPQE
jgi:hypothetical protein